MIQALKERVKRTVGRRLIHKNRLVLEGQGVLVNDRLDPTLWDCAVDGAGMMHWGGLDLQELARRFGTPLHVLNVDRLHADLRMFMDAFSGTRAHVRLGTSYKTNPLPFLLERLHSWGTSAEVISPFELWLALELGVPGEHIIFNGPGKSIQSLELAVDSGVWLINADSKEELEDLERVCAIRGRRQDVGIRVTTSVGWRSQFGLNVANGDAFRAFELAQQSDFLNPMAIHLHLGTGIRSIETYAQGVAEVIDLAGKVNRDLGTRVRVLDLGGGFGVPTTTGITEWDHRLQHVGYPLRTAIPSSTPTPEAYAARIVPLVDHYFEDFALEGDGAELVLEPGRAVTASAQLLLLSVMRVKERDDGTPDVILDGGRNVAQPLAWEFHEIHPVGKMLDTTLKAQNLYGPLCHPYDIIALHKMMPHLEPLDVLAIMDAGAYFIPNQTNFANPRPGVVAIENGTAHVVRRPEEFSDIVQHDRRSSANTLSNGR